MTLGQKVTVEPPASGPVFGAEAPILIVSALTAGKKDKKKGGNTGKINFNLIILVTVAVIGVVGLVYVLTNKPSSGGGGGGGKGSGSGSGKGSGKESGSRDESGKRSGSGKIVYINKKKE